jgi:hypothetical protein
MMMIMMMMMMMMMMRLVPLLLANATQVRMHWPTCQLASKFEQSVMGHVLNHRNANTYDA